MAVDRQPRVLPIALGGGVEYLPSVSWDAEPVEGWTGTNLPKSPAGFSHGFQSMARKVARQVSTPGGLYPDDGSGTLAAQANSGQANIKLAANVLQTQGAGLDPTGMLLAGRYGTSPDRYEIVRVISWTSGTQTVVANRNLTNTWANGAKYMLLFDIRLAETVHVLSEFSLDTVVASVELVFFDWALDPAFAPRTVIRTFDQELALANTAIQGAAGEIEETSFYYGRLRSRPARGFMGLKVRQKTVTGGSNSLWLARS